MKLDCGPTKQERFEQRLKKNVEKAKRLERWHKRFAWWPIRLGSRDCRWLELIERRGNFIWYNTYDFEFWGWEYRAINE